MRKILAFGHLQGFLKQYSDFFERNGFTMKAYRTQKSGRIDSSDPPVLLVFGGGLNREEERGLGELLSSLRKPQLIFIKSDMPPGQGITKKARDRASHVLETGFYKKDLLAALKSADELLCLRETEGSLQADLKRKSRELSCVLDVTRLLSYSIDFSKAINRIMEKARTMVNAQSWAVFLVDETNEMLVFNSAKGVAASRDTRLRLMPGEGIAGWAMQDMKPRVVQDVSTEPRFTDAVDKVTGVKTKSVMAVPISVKNRLLGVAELINKNTPGGFTAEDLKMVKVLMNQTALAVERSELYQKMEDLAITDDLTKLFNLRYLDRTLDIEIERAARYNLSVSLIFMDIDYFKNVNDRYGHLIGSKLLVEVSRILLQGLRKVDIVARYGGDEFVIVLPQTDVKAAKMIAERMRQAIEKTVFMKSDNLNLNLTASFGIASYPEHASSQEELLRFADEAMYRVKNQTRNGVYVVGS